jgi:citrate lyase subunit beta/citryl-CoA lyase
VTVSTSQIESARSLLFVPGNRPDRFTKAASAGANLIIIDLEDAVAPQDKDVARGNAAAWLAEGRSAVIRVNAPGTPWCDADLDMAASYGSPVMVPKAEVAALEDIACRTAERCLLIPLIETAGGVEKATQVCAVTGTVRAAFGNIDLASQLGVAHDDHLALTYARSKLVSASAAAQLAPPLDGVTTSVGDADALTSDVAHCRRLGFTGKLCIHPAQIPVIAAGFAPSDSELQWARAVLAAGDSVTVIDGHMVDKPVIERARRVLGASS